MEDDLDRIADGEEERVDWLSASTSGGNGDEGLHALVTDQLGEIDARDINSIPIGNDIVLRIGRYGPYLERGDKRARSGRPAAGRADRRSPRSCSRSRRATASSA